MKLNKISMVLAAMAIVGCSSEDVSEFGAKQALEDSRLVELTPDFVLAGVGESGVNTRTHWEWEGTPGSSPLVNKFLPIYKATATFGGKLDADADLTAQAVGLCWLGQGAVGTDVYTNYEFYHFGWLNKGETKANFECGKLQNGSLYNEITMTTGTASKEAVPGTDWVVGGLPAKSVKAGVDNLNYNSGIYKTDNKAIFGGQYIVYYPFNANFKEAGTIPAKAETVFNNVSTDFDTPEVGKATFRYSAPVTIEGGDQAADFGMYNLSSLVQLKVFAPAGDAALGQKVDQIVLYSKSEKLLKQANLAADKIVAGQKGADLYASTEGTKTIAAKFKTGEEVTLAVKASAAKGAFITVLPTTVEDLVVLVHNSTGKKWARINMPNTVFEAGKAKRLEITVTAADFKSEYIAVDEATLQTALNEARPAAGAWDKKTIEVIGDITLKTTPFDIANTKDEFITIKGDDIIVPEDVTLNVNTNMESNLRVLGTSCCSGTNGGIVDVKGGTLNNVTMEPTEAKTPTLAKNPKVTYSGAATVAAGKTFDAQAGEVIVNAPVQHKGNINIAAGVKLTVDGTGTNTGDLNFMGSTVVNNGTIEVLKGGKFDMTDANGNATTTDGQRMTNNGKFIHNVDAGVGTAVQSMQQNGEYRCKVNEQIKLDDAFLQWTACSVIEIVDHATTPQSYNLGTAAGITPDAYKHNGKYIDIEVNTPSNGVTTFNNPVVSGSNGDSKVIMVGNLTVTAGGLDIDYVKGTGKRTLTVNGDMVVKANTTIKTSKKINVTENLTVSAGTLTYKGAKKNEDGLAVTKDITVSGATFDADEVNALNITCANFYLEKSATAKFGNRTDGAAKNLVVSGTISNPATCTFSIHAANQNGAGSVLAWVTCKKLEVGGTFSAARPRVE